MNTPISSFVVVGAGQAARWLVLTLRKEGYAGPIVWISEESGRPYERPPLSKAILLGKSSPDAIELFSPEAFAALNVDWRPGQVVEKVDRRAHCVTTSNGDLIPYAKLFLATGGRARTLEGVPSHPRIQTLRTVEDALRLKLALEDTGDVLVLGGGWIGLEIAAAARSLGRRVTLLEAAPRLCIRSVAPPLSDLLRDLHMAHGVDLRLGCKVGAVHADDAGVAIALDDGSTLHGDLLVVGIGLVPNFALATAAGLAVENGILVDADCRTSDPDIYAAGDVANGLRADRRHVRLESWENAQRMGIAAARAALGLPRDEADVAPPWFWSDQYEDNLQVLGATDPDLRVIERRDPSKKQHIFYFCAADRIRGVAAVNGGREIKIARKWMAQQAFPRLSDLQDLAIDLAKLPCQSSQ